MNKEFEFFWSKYPKKLGKKEAFKHFRSSVITKEDLGRFEKALFNYLKHVETDQVEFQFIQHGKTFFNNWEDWEHYEVPRNRSRTELDVEATDKYLKELTEN